MATFILIIIYVSFICLGLPDSLLGVSWPLIRTEYNVSLSAVGPIYMMIAGGTIISSFFSGKVLNRFGTAKVTAVSTAMTALGIIGFYLAPSIHWFYLMTIPLGLGAGSVDAGLNAYVANHYKSHHMSWLHCFWGVGATVGPMIMSLFIKDANWRRGYLTVALLQAALALFLFLTLPVWKKADAARRSNTPEHNIDTQTEKKEPNKESHLLKVKGVKPVLITFLFYCAAEGTLGLWGSSYLVQIKGLDASIAATWVAMYYGGITVGRFLNGFLTLKINNKQLVRLGLSILLIGVALLLLPLPTIFTMIGMMCVGLGCAPIYPCLLHETPVRFGEERSKSLMGIQMAVAYTGATFLPPIFGYVAGITSVAIYPIAILVYTLVMILCSEKANRIFANK
ncbi:MAG: transporter [Herbinix sp.]|jgi:fucose permease|nr:transporter [Herbinix sp.]